MPNRPPVHRTARVHGALAPDYRKRRIYNSRLWRDRQTQRILARDPVCRIAAICKGMALSTEVDHIVAIEDGGDESDDNLQGTCKPCHSDKTARERRARWQRP